MNSKVLTTIFVIVAVSLLGGMVSVLFQSSHSPEVPVDSNRFLSLDGGNQQPELPLEEKTQDGPLSIPVDRVEQAPQTLDESTPPEEPKKGACLRGLVVDADGNPVAKATLSFNQDGSPFLRRRNAVVSGAEGRFERWDLVPNTRYDIQVTHPRFVDKVVKSATSTRDEPREIEIQLLSGLELRGHVFDTSGQTVDNALVWATKEAEARGVQFNRPTPPWAYSNAEGVFRITGIESLEDLHLRAMTPNHNQAQTGPLEPQRALHRLELVPGKPIAGRVTDSLGTPIPNLEVIVQPQSARLPVGLAKLTSVTDQRGQFHFPHVCAGHHSLQTKREGYQSLTRSVESGSVNEVIELQRLGRIQGFIEGHLEKETPFRFELARYTQFGAGKFRRIEDFDGAGNLTFDLKDVAPGTYVLRAVAPTMAPSRSAEFEVLAGETTSGVMISVQAGGSFGGRVIDAISGESVAQAQIRITRTQDPGAPPNERRMRRNIKTTPKGQFLLQGLKPGRWTIEILHDRYAVHLPTPLDVSAHEHLRGLEFRLSKGGEVFGTVLDRGGNPRLYDQVVAISTHNPKLSKRASVQTDGTYRIEHLPPGDFRIKRVRRDSPSKANHGNSAEKAPSVTVQDRQSIEIHFDDSQLGILTGIVMENGKPLAKVSLKLQRIGARFTSYQATSDREGEFEIEGIVPGRYEIQTQPQTSLTAQVAVIDIKEGIQSHRLEWFRRKVIGRVITSEGAPIENVTLSIRRASEDNPLIGSSTTSKSPTDAAGAFILDGVSPGTYLLTLSHETFVPADSIEFEVKDSDWEKEIGDMVMTEGGQIFGQVFTSTGVAMAHTNVTIFPIENIRVALTDENGHYRTPCLPAGTYTLHAGRAGESKRIEGIEVRGGESIQIDVHLEKSKSP